MSGTMLAAMLASTPAGTHRGRNVHDAGTQTDDKPPSAFFDEVPTTFFPPPPPYTPVSDADNEAEAELHCEVCDVILTIDSAKRGETGLDFCTPCWKAGDNFGVDELHTLPAVNYN